MTETIKSKAARRERLYYRGLISFVVTFSFPAMTMSGAVMYAAPRGRDANWSGWMRLNLWREQRFTMHIMARTLGGVRNGGQELTLQSVQAAMLCHDMICVSDGKDSAHFGAALFSGGPGGIKADQDGLNTPRNLGRRVAELAGRLVSRSHVGPDRAGRAGNHGA